MPVAAIATHGKWKDSSMKYSYLISAGVALMLAACANTAPGDMPGNFSTSGQRLTDSNDPALAAVMNNLPAGVTVKSASQQQLYRAVKRTTRMHPELSGEIVESLTKVSPGRKGMIKKAVTDASTPYSRPYGRGGKP
jgi:hypothetical protein